MTLPFKRTLQRRKRIAAEFWLFNYLELKKTLDEMPEKYSFSLNSLPQGTDTSDKTFNLATDPTFMEISDKLRIIDRVRAGLDSKAAQLINNVYIYKRWTDTEAMRRMYMSPATYYRFRAFVLDKFVKEGL